MEAKCTAMDELAQEDHAHKLTKAEFDRYRSNWSTKWNDPGDNGPMASRADYRAAVAL